VPESKWVGIRYDEAMSLADPILYESQIEGFSASFKAPIPWQTAESIRSAIEGKGDNVKVSVTLPKATAEKVLALVNLERTGGALVVPAASVFTVADAAVILRIPKDELITLIEIGRVPAQKYRGSWVIRAEDIVEYIGETKSKQLEAMRRLAR